MLEPSKCRAECTQPTEGFLSRAVTGWGYTTAPKKPSATTAAHPPARSSHSPPPPQPSCPFCPISFPKSAHNDMETESSLLLLLPQLHSNHHTSKLWPSCVHPQHSHPLGFEANPLQQATSIGIADSKELRVSAEASREVLSTQQGSGSPEQALPHSAGGQEGQSGIPEVGYLEKPQFNFFPRARACQEPQEPPPSSGTG